MSEPLAMVLAISVGVAGVLTPAFRAFGRRLRLVDVPNERSSHAVPTPRTGGLAIMLGIVAATALSGTLPASGLQAPLLGAIALGALALADDFNGLPNALRLSCHALVAMAVVAFTSTRLTGLEVPWAGVVPFGALAPVVSVFWLVGVTNAYNFMDGINGIASLEAIVCGATLAMVFAAHGDLAGAALSIAIVGASSGFLPWNLYRGSIFMGDVGSTGLGFLLAFLVLRGQRHVPFAAAMLPLFPFLFDTTITLVRRIWSGERFFSTAHRTHCYQLLVAAGYRHTQVSALWAGLAALGGALCLAYNVLSDGQRLLGIAILLAVHVLVARTAIRMRSRDRLIATAAGPAG